MGWSVVAENGSYNWMNVLSGLSKGPDPGDITGSKLSQHYQCEIEVIDELRPDLFLRRCLGLSRKRNAHFIHHRFEDFS